MVSKALVAALDSDLVGEVLESTEPADDAELVATWRALLDRHARTMGALERALHEEQRLGVSEFEVLERLSEPDDDQRRMQELAQSVHLSQSALSRVVGRLEEEGLVSRGICAEDRRGIYACLTDAGRARYEAARPTHRRVLRETL
jgi:DNA-binding MarR family transcriptional regulator